MRDLSGTSLGHYAVRERIGAGGMGDVYRAVQESLGREVALKVLASSLLDQEGFMRRFEQEARTVAQLDHPNILAVFDFGAEGDVTYLAMPLVRGGTLKDRMAGRPLELQQTFRYLSEVADALHHAHEAGLVHRDVKPTNVLLHTDGRSVLSDFGLARTGGGPTALSAYGLPIGTPGYMAPEQALGKPIDRRSDVYALGVMLFEMLTGTMPYEAGSAVALMVASLNEPVPSARARNSSLPPDVDLVLVRAMAKDPADRPATTLDLLQLFRGSVRGASVIGTPAPGSVPTVSTGSTVTPSILSYAGLQQAMLNAPPTPTGSAVATLEQMGVPRLRATLRHSLNSHFADTVHVARDVAGDRWPQLIRAAGLQEYVQDDPPVNEERTTPIENLSKLNEAFDVTFGGYAPEKIRQWGRQATDRSILQRKSSTTEQRAMKLLPGQQRKLSILLNSFTKSMDGVRGEHLHTWKQIDSQQFWLVHYSNLYALGRRKSEKSCHIWTASFEAMLRWVGLANDWLVEEIECGCVNGTFDCVFAIRSVKRSLKDPA